MSRRTGFALAMALLLGLGLIASYLLGKLEPYEDVIEHGPAPRLPAALTWPPNTSCASRVSSPVAPKAWLYWTVCPARARP